MLQDVFLFLRRNMNTHSVLTKYLEAVICALNVVVQHALCLVRPPGHHAHASVSRGFCVTNNVGGAIANALATDAALQRVL